MSSKCTYTVYSSSLSKKGGNYKSTSPGLAAKKACAQLLKSSKDDEASCTFELRELGVHDKVFCYQGKRKLKDKPLVIKMGGNDVTIKWDYVVKPCSPAVKTI